MAKRRGRHRAQAVVGSTAPDRHKARRKKGNEERSCMKHPDVKLKIISIISSQVSCAVSTPCRHPASVHYTLTVSRGWNSPNQVRLTEPCRQRKAAPWFHRQDGAQTSASRRDDGPHRGPGLKHSRDNWVSNGPRIRLAKSRCTLFRFGSLRRSRRFLPFSLFAVALCVWLCPQHKTTATTTVTATNNNPCRSNHNLPLSLAAPSDRRREAERAASNDTLSEQDETRLGRRQALIDYYCAATDKPSCEGMPGWLSAFSRASSSSTQRNCRIQRAPDTAQTLAAAKASIGRFSRRGAPGSSGRVDGAKTLNPTDPGPALRYQQLVDWLHGPGDQSPNAVPQPAVVVRWPLLHQSAPTLASDLELAYRQWPVPLIHQTARRTLRA